MSNGFVEQHTWPARSENHIEIARWRIDGVQIHDCLAGRLPRKVLITVVLKQGSEFEPSAAAADPRLPIASVLGDATHRQADERQDIAHDQAFSRGDQNDLLRI